MHGRYNNALSCMIQFGDLRYFISCTLAVFHKTLLSSSTFGTERNPLKINKEIKNSHLDIFPHNLRSFEAPLNLDVNWSTRTEEKKSRILVFLFKILWTLTLYNIIRREKKRRLLKNMFLFHFSLPFEAKKENKILSFAVSLFTHYWTKHLWAVNSRRNHLKIYRVEYLLL